MPGLKLRSKGFEIPETDENSASVEIVAFGAKTSKKAAILGLF
jgi:hypothetical protein